jgi:hypothetical protein
MTKYLAFPPLSCGLAGSVPTDWAFSPCFQLFLVQFLLLTRCSQMFLPCWFYFLHQVALLLIRYNGQRDIALRLSLHDPLNLLDRKIRDLPNYFLRHYYWSEEEFAASSLFLLSFQLSSAHDKTWRMRVWEEGDYSAKQQGMIVHLVVYSGSSPYNENTLKTYL